jgi:dTDP-4-dehydrorhamnose reductase
MSRILVLGSTGMLGNAMLRLFADDPAHEIFGTARSGSALRYFPDSLVSRLRIGIDVENADALAAVMAELRPDVVINCVGVIKQLENADDPLAVLPINALLPHRLARLCALGRARLVHISTDCVFNGSRGGYVESDVSDAEDLYGRSKLLGEVTHTHTVTLRTSIIGHELASAHGLIGWFLSQDSPVRGFTKAIFSGLPTVELARIIKDRVLPDGNLAGLYHVAANPISKYDLLNLVAKVYGKRIDIVPDDKLVIDRSLNADRFNSATGYLPPDWPQLIKRMHDFG